MDCVTVRSKPVRLLLIVLTITAASAQPPAPAQPIPFSHKVHAGDSKLPCKTCHANPDPGDQLTIASAAQCMQCHSAIKTESPSIQKLAAFAKNDREIKWQRVYQVPGYVHFNHRAHTAAGTACATCHGPVAQRDELAKEVDISMGACMACHNEKKVSIDCSFCHEAQPGNP